jgi:hypothetical protein
MRRNTPENEVTPLIPPFLHFEESNHTTTTTRLLSGVHNICFIRLITFIHRIVYHTHHVYWYLRLINSLLASIRTQTTLDILFPLAWKLLVRSRKTTIVCETFCGRQKKADDTHKLGIDFRKQKATGTFNQSSSSHESIPNPAKRSETGDESSWRRNSYSAYAIGRDTQYHPY